MAIPIAAGLAVAGAAKQLFSKHKRPDNRAAIAALRASRPTGYLTPEDYLAASRVRGRLSEGVQGQGRLQGYEIGRRFQARGLAGSPAEERSRARLDQNVLLGQEHAGESAEDYLSNLRTGRESYQHQNDLAIFGAQVDQNQRDAARMDAQQGAFWNSLNEFMPAIIGGLNPNQVAPINAGAYGPMPDPYQGGSQVGPPTGPTGSTSPVGRPTTYPQRRPSY